MIEGKEDFKECNLSDEDDKPAAAEENSPIAAKAMMNLTESNNRRASYIDIGEKEPIPRKSVAPIPNSDTFLKLTSYRASDFQMKWAAAVFLCNIYNCFSATLFLGTTYQPTGFWLGLEAISELLLLADMLARLSLNGTNCWRKMWMLHDSESWRFRFLRLVLSSLPYSILLSIIESHNLDNGKEIELALMRLLKLLRAPQLVDFYTSLELILKSRHLLLLRAVKLVLVLLAITHIGAICFLIVGRVENSYSSIETWSLHSGNEVFRYIDGWFWSTCSMTGIGYGDIVPHTDLERLATIVVMLAGASFYAEIFGQMVLAMHTIQSQTVENTFNMQKATQWAKERHLGPAIMARLHNYYSLVRQHYRHISNSAFLGQLPLSLRTEISMFLQEDLIQKVKIFELGDPSFILAIVRHLNPKIYMSEDFIIRRGDIADDFFLIQQGSVQVLATDESTVIAVMSEGGFFGEIGVLLQTKRSVSVRTVTSVLASAINKDHLIGILKNFPDQEAFLNRIGRQRLRTTNPEDLDLEFQLKQPSRNNTEKIAVVKQKEVHSLPHRILNKIFPKWFWPALEPAIFLYNIMYVPMAIAFNFRLLDVGMAWDLLTIAYNLFFVSKQLRSRYYRSYLNTTFTYDFLSSLPIDYIMYGLNNSLLVCNLFMVVSLVRGRKLGKMLSLNPALKIGTYFLVLAVYLHIAACVYFLVARIQHEYFPRVREDAKDWFSVFDEAEYTHFGPMLELTVGQQYVLALYLVIMSLGDAHGPLGPQTPAEKLTIFTTMILSKCFIAFVYAEAATFISFSHELFTHHLQKVTMVSSWMHHLKLPLTLKSRVDKYYDMLWVKLKGHHDSEIMSDLPESLRTDIASVLFGTFTQSELFSNCDQGAILAIIRRCKVTMACAGESILSEGELGLEMYFVLEGSVEVVSSQGVVLATVGEGQPLGEMALLNNVPTLRMANVVSKTNVTLAMLSLEDFRLVMESYPEFESTMLEKARIRLAESKRKMQKSNPLKPFLSGAQFDEDPQGSMDSNNSIPASPLSAPMATNGFIEETEQALCRSRTALPSSATRSPKFHLSSKETLEKLLRYIHFLVLPATIYNLFMMPLIVAFSLPFADAVLAFEILTVLIFAVDVVYGVVSEPRVKWWKTGHRAMVAFPFAWVCWSTPGPRWMFTALALIRITDVTPVMMMFTLLKARNCNWVNVLRVIEVLCYYLILCHVLGMIMLSMAPIEGDIIQDWIIHRSEDPPSPSSVNPSPGGLYVYGVFWACLIISHRGVGDIVNATISERAFSCVLMFGLSFVHAMLFGNFTSLISSLSSRLKSKLYHQYKTVMEVITKKKLGKEFIRQMSDYFTYIWHTNQGLSELEILEELPNSLQADIMVARYGGIMESAGMFTDVINGRLNYQLARSLLKLIKVRHYLVGDTVLNAGDKGSELFILLHGEVQVVSMEGRRILATLKPGELFGEANLLFNWTTRRTASVVCTSIVTVGVLEAKYFNMLIVAFPEWERLLAQNAFERLKDTFQSEDVEVMKTRLYKIASTFISDPNYYHRAIQRRKTLTAPIYTPLVTISKQPSYLLEILHLAVILYTSAMLPLAVGFRLEIPIELAVLEGFCIVESMVFMLKNARPRVFFEARKVWGFRQTLSYYYHNGLFGDLLAISPFFLIFSLLDLDNDWAALLKLIRLFCVFRLKAIFERIELRHRNLARYFQILRTLLFLLILLHCSTCWWNYVTTGGEEGFSWFYEHRLEYQSLTGQYLFASYYTMSYVTAVAYGDQLTFCTAERLATVVIIIAGDALFGVAFGMMAELSISAETKYSSYLTELKNAMDYLSHYSLSLSLITRLEQYFAYRWAITEEIGLTNLDELYELLPKNIVEKIMYESNKTLIRSLPILNSYGSDSLIQLMSTKLKPEIYLPLDYVIYQNDIGEEMYFIIEGVVDILVPNSDKVMAQLHKGQFLGEIALIEDTRRPFSALASTFCLLYILQKAAFQVILEEYPDVKTLIQQEGYKRTPEGQVKRRARKSMTLGSTLDASEPSDDEFYNMFGWSMISRDQMKKRMTTPFEASQSQVDTSNRRPHISGGERRFSQMSFGKELVLSRFTNLKMQWTMERAKPHGTAEA